MTVLAVAAVACGGGGGGGTTAPPPPPTYSISGTVTGAASVTVALTGASKATTTTDSNGNYSFTGLANGTYTVAPTLGGYSYNPASTAVTVSGANVTGKNFAATPAVITYSISGSINLGETSGVTLTLSGNNSGSVVSISGGTWTISNLVPGSYTVTPSLAGYTFKPASIPLTIVNTSLTGNNFLATALPVPYSISGTVSGAVKSGVLITVTGPATATATTDSNGNYSVPGLFNGTYTVTPSLAGYTFTQASANATINGATVTGTNFVASSAVVTPGGISGQVTGPWVAGVTVTLSGTSTGTTTTNASGNYSFSGLPVGSYTVTPSLPGYTFSPSAPGVAVATNATTTQNFTSSTASVLAAYSLSGTVSYAGAQTGLVYVRVYIHNSCTACPLGSPVAGTSVSLSSGSAPYTIRGLAPNTYTVVAGMDIVGNGTPNASDPSGSPVSPPTITNANVTGADITLTDPATVTPVTPSRFSISPSSGSVVVQYVPLFNASGQELPTAYKVYWGTDATASVGGGSATFAAQGSWNNVYFLSGLTNGTAYYFRMSSLVGTTESALSTTVVGPVAIGATTGSNTVSGTVTFPGAATGPLYVGVYSHAASTFYFQMIANPVSPQSYSVAGVPNGNYENIALLDMNNDGAIDAGDIMNTGNLQAPKLTVSSNTTANVTLASVPEVAFAATNFYTNGTTSGYGINLGTNDGTNRAVAVVVYSGPNVVVPYDLGANTGNTAYFSLGTATPTVGDTYGFQVTYEDGTTSNILASVSAVLNSGAVVTNPTVTPASTIPTFSWAAPSSPPAWYVYFVGVTGIDDFWYDSNNGGGLPSTVTSVVYDADSSATLPSLTGTNTYNWQIVVQDASGNSASYQGPPYMP